MIQDEVFYEQAHKKKRYTPEFKREAVSLVTEHGYSKAEAGRSLDVNPNQIRRWQLEFEADGSDAFPGQGKLTPDQRRIRDLESENRRLTTAESGPNNRVHFTPEVLSLRYTHHIRALNLPPEVLSPG